VTAALELLQIAIEEDHPLVAIGDPVPPFEGLLGTDGLRHSLRDYSGAAALVVIFSSNRCPTAKAYASRLRALQADYAPRGVQILLLNANAPHLYPDEAFEKMVERAAEDGYTFPYLVDAGQQVARAWGPTCTFHAFLLDRERRLAYEGRVDNARLEDRATRHDLRDALEDVLAGRPVAVPQTRAFGCSLDIV
jgi:peroxiredoxin